MSGSFYIGFFLLAKGGKIESPHWQFILLNMPGIYCTCRGLRLVPTKGSGCTDRAAGSSQPIEILTYHSNYLHR